MSTGLGLRRSRSEGFVVNPYAIGAAVAAIGVVGGLFGVVVAARGKDTGSVFRTRATTGAARWCAGIVPAPADQVRWCRGGHPGGVAGHRVAGGCVAGRDAGADQQGSSSAAGRSPRIASSGWKAWSSGCGICRTAWRPGRCRCRRSSGPRIMPRRPFTTRWPVWRPASPHRGWTETRRCGGSPTRSTTRSATSWCWRCNGRSTPEDLNGCRTSCRPSQRPSRRR